MSALPVISQSEAERAFGDALLAAGFNAGAIQADTKDFVRFDAPGDKAGRRNGFYKLSVGKFPVGWFGDWKTGEQHEWRWDYGRELTATERKHIKDEQRRLKAEAQRARELRQREVAEDASRLWKQANQNGDEVARHAYVERKGMIPPRGLRLHISGDKVPLVVVPMFQFDLNGEAELVNCQTIDPRGSKRFMKAGKVEGTWFSLKGDTSVIIICEGVATAFSIWRATGLSVVAAFNAGNLIPVAKDVALNRPLAKLMIAGDNDVIEPEDWAERGGGRPWVNAGATKAEAAAKAVGCRWIVPAFVNGPDRSRTDFDDLCHLEGEEMVRAQIMGAWQSVAAQDSEPGATIIQPDFVQDESWRTSLPKDGRGNPDGGNVLGISLYLDNHRLLRGRLAWNEFTQTVEFDGNNMADHNVSEFRRVLHGELFKSKRADLMDEMLSLARREAFDPLTRYLRSLKWDNVERVDTMLARYFGAEDSDYGRQIGRKSMIAAVARALRPGCKVDTMLVLEGAQGKGKSTGIRYLFGDRFFTDHLPDFHSKDAFLQLQGSWCVEVAELQALSKADIGDIKQFLTRVEDKFRPPYGRFTVKVPRRTVLWGTVNPVAGQGYLRDPTGGRRFWPVATGYVDTAAILTDRDQLWAEAVHLFESGYPWHIIDDDFADVAQAEQEARRESDAWEAVIAAWIVDNSIAETTTWHAARNALQMAPEKLDDRTMRRVASCLHVLGWRASKKAERFQGVTSKVYRPQQSPYDGP